MAAGGPSAIRSSLASPRADSCCFIHRHPVIQFRSCMAYSQLGVGSGRGNSPRGSGGGPGGDCPGTEVEARRLHPRSPGLSGVRQIGISGTDIACSAGDDEQAAKKALCGILGQFWMPEQAARTKRTRRGHREGAVGGFYYNFILCMWAWRTRPPGWRAMGFHLPGRSWGF